MYEFRCLNCEVRYPVTRATFLKFLSKELQEELEELEGVDDIVERLLVFHDQCPNCSFGRGRGRVELFATRRRPQ